MQMRSHHAQKAVVRVPGTGEGGQLALLSLIRGIEPVARSLPSSQIKEIRKRLKAMGG